MAKTLICTYGYRALDHDWTAGQLVVVSDEDATRLLGFYVQVASSVHGIFREATAEEAQAAGADALEWGVPVTRVTAPPRSELAGLPLEALRATGVSHGLVQAHDLTQDQLLDAFDQLAGRAPAPSAAVTPLPLGSGRSIDVPPVSPNGLEGQPGEADATSTGSTTETDPPAPPATTADNQSGAASA